MDIVDHGGDWSTSEKGRKDIERHREKIDDHIRKNVKDVIAEESIITSSGNEKVKIPVRGLRDYRFIHGSKESKAGIGQGPAGPGDTFGRRDKGKGESGNQAGNELGEEIIETEVDIDYLIKIMFEDLGLPYLETKTKNEIMVLSGWKFKTIDKKGIFPQVHKKRSVMETIKRTAAYVGEIIRETECTEDDAYIALAQAKGDLDEAILVIRENRLDRTIDSSILFMEDDDLRYRKVEENLVPHSSAVVAAVMDVSGSMGSDKKYLARSFLFWMVQFLKKCYDNVDIVFIVHTTEAKEVDEHTFFRRMESGGTYCYTGVELAKNILNNKYPVDSWSRYIVQITDSEDFDPARTIEEMKSLIKSGLNMYGYIEVLPDGEITYGDNLLQAVLKSFDFKTSTEKGANYYKDETNHILAARITNKEGVYGALKHLLFQKKQS